MAATPILRYALTTEPFPLQASPQNGNLTAATLTIIATNPTQNPVTLQGLSVTLPVGNGSTDLTPDATSISPIPPPDWTLNDTEPSTGQIKYIFYPTAGHEGVGSEGLNFVFNDVEINGQTGTVAIEIMEGSNNCQPPDCPTTTLDLTKFPHGWGEVSFSADPTNIAYDTSTTLSWDGPQGATYTIDYYTPQTGVVTVPTTGQPPLSNSGQYPGTNAPPLTLTQTTTFTLNVEERIDNQPYQAQRQVTVTVVPPPPPLKPLPKITQFTGKFEPVGTTITLVLTWRTEHTTQCMISGISTLFGSNGSTTIYPSVDSPLNSIYTLTASNKYAPTTTSQITVIWGEDAQIQIRTSPSALAISPDGTRVFITSAAENTVSVLKTTTDHISGPALPVGYEPISVAVSPDGSRVFVANTFDNTVSVLDATTDSVKVSGPPIKVGTGPSGVAISPDGTHVFITNWDDNTLSVLNATTDSVKVSGPPIKVGAGPSGVAISPDGTRVFVTNSIDNTLSVLKATTVPPQVYATATAVGSQPKGVVVSLDGAWVFVANSADNSVSVLDVNTLLPVVKPIPVGMEPGSLAISTDGNSVFVANLVGGSISVLETTSHPISALPKPIKVGCGPKDLAISPDGCKVFVANNGEFTVSVLVPTSVTGGIGN